MQTTNTRSSLTKTQLWICCFFYLSAIANEKLKENAEEKKVLFLKMNFVTYQDFLVETKNWDPKYIFSASNTNQKNSFLSKYVKLKV